jgi:DNA-binding response OmpR family regulator
MSNNALVFIVEDDKQLSHINSLALQSEGYEVAAAYTFEEARAMMKNISPDIILLDVKLPGGSGFDLCREIRGKTDAYIIYLTSVQELSGEMEGFDTGGDDYLRKPFDIDVLLKRVERGLRHKHRASQFLRFESLTLDKRASQADLDGKDLLLAPKEFSILLLLLENRGQVLGAEYLYNEIWKQPMNNDNQSVKKTVHRLRESLSGSGFTVPYDNAEKGWSIKYDMPK